MRTEDLDDDLADDLDDTSCTQQKPKRRHCMRWFLVGDYVVIGCAHCPKVRKSWLAVSGDSERVSESETTHASMCVRLVPWLFVPAQRRQHRAHAFVPSAAPRPSTTGR
jgi:glutamate racemase